MLLWWMMATAWGADWSVFEDGQAWSELATREREGLTVRVRHRLHDDVNCFEGRTRAEVAPEALLAAAVDIEGAPAWSAAPLPRSEVLHREGTTLHYVQHVDIPDWTLVHDRFWVLRGEPATLDGGTTRFRWTRLDAASTYPAVHAELTGDAVDALEVPVNWGEWHFTPTPDGPTDIAYRVCTDAGGAVPTWLQRVTTRKTLPDVVINLIGAAKALGD